MFAPHCPTCETRVLLGPARIVHFADVPYGGHVVVLRCRCGTLVGWGQQPPKPEDTGEPSSTTAAPEEPMPVGAAPAASSRS